MKTISAQPEVLEREIETTHERVVVESRGPAWYTRALAVVGVVAVYAVYRKLRVGAGRDVFHRGLPVGPFRHALTVLKVEHALSLDIERGVQRFFLHNGFIVRFANGYYSWAHQIVTLSVVAIVLLRAPWGRAKRWVGGLLLQLPVALVMFRLYPLMPPRLLDAGAPWGGRLLEVHRNIRPTGIVDTLTKLQGPWTPGTVPLHAFTNQYAAMPSLHCAFALWVGIVWWKHFKGRPWRFFGPLHAAFLFFSVIVTGNHYVLDAIVGWFICLAALAVTCRGSWLLKVRRSYVAQGDSTRMPSTTSVSQ